MKLLNDLVLIKEIKAITERTTLSGLVIPVVAEEKEYEVLQIGNKCKALCVGDKLRLHEHVNKIPLNEHYLVRESLDIKVIL